MGDSRPPGEGEATPFPAGAPSRRGSELAPTWHTGALIGLILTVAVAGTLLTRTGVAIQPETRATGYVQRMVVAWGLLLYVTCVGRAPGTLKALLGRTWQSSGRALTDVLLALVGWLLLEGCEVAWGRLLGTHAPPSVAAMLPHGPVEGALWVALSVSVGCSEEVVFRGYLTAQLTGLTGRAAVANMLQAALFGVAHAEQGIGALVRLTAYGLAFGILARARRSLLPGILCHVWTNVASGLLRP